MVRVEYDSIHKRYGDTIAVEEVDVTVEDGEFAVLLGPSGCGKTTTLRCLAGLTEPTSGKVRLDGQDVTDVHPKNRNIAMVFQQFALYPHMNVRENIGYPLKVEGVSREKRRERVEDAAEMMEIEELLDREVDNLSGGQRQRVALGRALIRRPAVFLMDEPLASLDAKLKVSMRSRINVLQRELGITTLYVTHDQEEAMTLGDKLIIMDDGNVQQVGTPDEVYHAPQNRFVAGFIGSPTMNFVEVSLDGTTVSSVANIPELEVDIDEEVAAQYRGYGEFELGVRPSYFGAHAEPVDNSIEGWVKVTEPLGDEQLIDVIVGDRDGIHHELTVEAQTTVDVNRGDAVWLTLQDDLVHGFDLDTGKRIGEANLQARAAIDSPESTGPGAEAD